MAEHLRRFDHSQVVLTAGRATLQMRGHTRVRSSRLATDQFLLDVPVQDLEASGAPGIDGVCGQHGVDVQAAVAVHEAPDTA